MAIDDSLDEINKKLATAVGHLERADSLMGSLGSSASSVNNAVKVSSTGGVGTAAGHGMAEAHFGNQASGDSGGGPKNISKSGEAKFSTPTSGSSDKSGSGNSKTADIMAGSLAAVSGVVSGVSQGLPGIAEAAGYKAATFLPSFTMPGGFNSKSAEKRIMNAGGSGFSGTMDMQAAATMASASGFSFGVGGNMLDKMLGASGFAFQMSGMSNQAAMQGQMGLYQGTSGAQQKLSSVGIFSVGMNGKAKDMGQIVDEMWARWYGSKNAKVPMERFQADLAMGFVGSDMQALFGSNPALYSQIVSLLQVKAAAGGRAGILAGAASSNPNSASAVAAKYGMTSENTPTVTAGKVNASRSKNIGTQANSGLMNAYNTSGDVISGFNNSVSSVTESLGGLAEVINNVRGLAQGVGGSEVGGFLSGITSAVSAAALFLAEGGNVRGRGTSTSDSINARLSHGEYVINARAAQNIGKDNLDALNSTGHAFGSGFASPAQMLATGGEVADYAKQFVGVPYDKSGGPGNPSEGWGCSGFTQYVYKQFGFDMPAYSPSQFKKGSPVNNLNDVAPGDLLFFHYADGLHPNDGPVNHVAIALDNKTMIGAVNTKNGTKITNIDTANFVGARRVLGASGVSSTSAAGTTPTTQETTTSNTPSGESTTSTSSPGSILYQTNDSKLFNANSSGLVGGGSDAGSTASLTGKSGDSNILSGKVGGATIRSVSAGAGDLDQAGFSRKILEGLGASTSGVTFDAMLAWVRQEGGHFVQKKTKYNPLNTGQKMPGSRDGLRQLQAYINWQQGIDATLKTFTAKNYGYENIVQAFQEGTSAKSIYDAIGNSHWGTKRNHLPSASTGIDTLSGDQLVNAHAGEIIMPAEPAQEFRRQLQDFLSHTKSTSGVTINLTVAQASEEEAVRFAKKVKSILDKDSRMERLRTR